MVMTGVTPIVLTCSDTVPNIAAGDVLRKVRKVWCFQRVWSAYVFLVIFGNKTSSALFFPKTPM